MEKKELKRLIEGYHTGTLSAEERKLLQDWYNAFGDDESGILALDDPERARRIERALVANIRQVMYRRTESTLLQRWRSWVPLAAASVLILVIGGLFWLTTYSGSISEKQATVTTPVFQEIKTGVRQLKQLTLPDSSIVYLNANSSVRISETLNEGKRLVLLDEGEAYFEVARDTLHPFVVRTSVGMEVEVLGTAFNVQAYREMANISVAVSHGKVRVSDTISVLGELTASEGMRYRKDSRENQLTRTDPALINAWIKGTVRLEEATFTELAIAMHNLYGVQLMSANSAIGSHRYNLIISTKYSLKEAMDVICSIHKTAYRRSGNEIRIF